MNYIEQIKAEIGRLKAIATHTSSISVEHYSKGYDEGQIDMCDLILSFIESLEKEQDVDLEKEYDRFVASDPVYRKLTNGIVGKSIARHFYELGLNARKKE